MKEKPEKKFNSAVYLRQIPVFALRKHLLTFLHEGESKKLMASRMKQALKRKTVPDPKKTIENLNRDNLVRVIKKYPEIDDAKIKELFEAYRYGTNPSFFIYLFTPKGKERKKIKSIQTAMQKSIIAYNLTTPKELPRVQKLAADDLFVIRHQPAVKDEASGGKKSKANKMSEVIEGTYRFQRRLELINDKENPISIYETVYGFFWINQEQGYAVIQAHDRSILHALEDAISKGAGLHLVNLMITKELKNALPFLFNDAIFSSKLYDPNPASNRFQKMTFTDEHLYDKGYNNWEKDYPGVSSARYKIKIEGMEGQRILNIGFDYGEMSLAGKLTASQFRDWALNCLSDIIEKIRDFEKQPSKYIKTRNFAAIRELYKYQASQKEVITKLLAVLLELKNKPGIDPRVLDRSPLEIARDLKNLVHVQFKVACQSEHCSMDGYLTCPKCKRKFFRVSEKDGIWSLACANDGKDNWSATLPIETQCELDHPLTLSVRDLEDWIEILPGRELLDVMSEIVKNYIPGTEFHGDVEYFMIIRQFMIYYKVINARSMLDRGTTAAIKGIQSGDIVDSNIILGDGNQIIIVKNIKEIRHKKQLSQTTPV